jgi:hemerythrin-like metal-binding protein
MPVTSWHEHHAADFQPIDAQHREMIEMLQETQAAAVEGRSARQVGSIFAKLVESIDRHFRDEELLMRANAWPSSDEHMRQHAGMLALVRDIEFDLQLGRIQPATALIQALADRLVAHTMLEVNEYRGRQGAAR